MAGKPRLFIGSSTESKRIASWVQECLEETVDTDTWDQNIFEAGAGILETLVDKSPTYDFALLVFGADDVATSRNTPEPSVRDNVLLEFGLFLGQLGRERTFFLYDKRSRPKIPTDLSGIVALTYDGNRIGDNPRAAVNQACVKIEEKVSKHGMREARLRPGPHLSYQKQLQYIGPDQKRLLSYIPDNSEISQRELEELGLYPPDVLYWRLEQLYLMGLVVKQKTDNEGVYPRYVYRLSSS
jgi:hypothetical protein